MNYKAKWMCIVLLVLMAGSLSGCVSVNLGSGGEEAGQGDMLKRSYDVGSFSSVEIKDMNFRGVTIGSNISYQEVGFELIYKNGREHKVEVEMQENLFEYIQVSVQEDRLILESSRNIRAGAGKRPKLYITTPEFNGVIIHGVISFKDADKIEGKKFDIVVSGVCDMDLDVNVENMKAKVSGAGSIKLQGSARSANIDLSGAGEIDALKLDTVDTEVRISGAGDCGISCSGSLRVYLSGVGSLKYKGSPEITKNVSGVGSIRQVD
ncbi:MAG: DUF2807 domain-containing protein [Peptococcaceae bacterium]|nr:DUF2807 domain-containing protein [Peptococcaceae bacterium]